MKDEILPKFCYLLSRFRWSLSPSKLEGPHEVILGDFPFFMVLTTCALIFFPNPPGQVVHNHHLVLRERNPIQDGHHMWNILALEFCSYISATHGTASKNKEHLPNKKIMHVWGMRFLYVIFGPHGSGHHPTPINTFHLRRLPPRESQTH
jgi:hypothetical protein